MEKLLTLFRWFDRNRERLIEGHYGEFALIKDNGVLGYYRTKADARLAVADLKNIFTVLTELNLIVYTLACVHAFMGHIIRVKNMALNF